MGGGEGGGGRGGEERGGKGGEDRIGEEGNNGEGRGEERKGKREKRRERRRINRIRHDCTVGVTVCYPVWPMLPYCVHPSEVSYVLLSPCPLQTRPVTVSKLRQWKSVLTVTLLKGISLPTLDVNGQFTPTCFYVHIQ